MLDRAKSSTSATLEQQRAKHEEAVLFLKLKLDGAKRQAEKDEQVHARLLKTHLDDKATAKQQYDAKVAAFQTERAATQRQRK